MDGFSEPVERDRLDVIFEIGGFLVGPGLREDTELARSHGHRAGAFQRIFQSDRCLAEKAGRLFVQRRDTGDLVDEAELQVILQVFPDPLDLFYSVDPGFG
ncbi:hypothetical protein D3C71_1035110 [compost metagenome]